MNYKQTLLDLSMEDQGSSHIERELRKEIDKNQIKYEKSCEILRDLIDEISFYSEENIKLDKVKSVNQELFEKVNSIKEELEFTKYCTKTYSLQSKVAPRQKLVKSIAHEMILKSGHSLFEMNAILKYKNELKLKSQQTDETLSIDKYSISFSKPEFQGGQNPSDENKSQNCSNSTDTEDLLWKKDAHLKGFRPNNGFKWSTSGDTFDLSISDQLLQETLGFKKLCRMTVMEAYQNRIKLAEFFTKHTMSDDLRKQFWRARIGNRLRISKPLFDSLVDRLETEGISRKAEKTIIDDLDRTFPVCNDMEEGKRMYQNMKLILSLFEVTTVDKLYRPDIGYVQGMSYLLLMLYYYFDVFESFQCLANLIVGNRLMRDFYTFDMPKVTSYTKMFDKLLQNQSSKLLHYFKFHGINTMTFSIDWFYTLYTRAFDLNIARVMWDMFFLFGSQFLVRAGVSLMVILEDELTSEYMNEGFNFVRLRTGKLKISDILECALKKGSDPNSFADVLEQFYYEFGPNVK